MFSINCLRDYFLIFCPGLFLLPPWPEYIRSPIWRYLYREREFAHEEFIQLFTIVVSYADYQLFYARNKEQSKNSTPSFSERQH
jgi:hypothetical protein